MSKTCENYVEKFYYKNKQNDIICGFCAEPLKEENLKLFRKNVKRYHSVIPNCGKSQCLHDNPGSKNEGWELLREKDEYKLSKTAQNEQKLRKQKLAEKPLKRKKTRRRKLDKQKKTKKRKL